MANPMIKLWFHLCLLGLLSPGLAWAEGNYCSETDLAGCSNLNDEACLQRYYACGQYNTILQHYATEDDTATGIPLFYKGISYYGLFIRNRSPTLRCRFAAAARSDLGAYMDELRDSAVTQTAAVDRLYLATKIHRELSQHSGCLEQGWSRREAEAFSREYAEERLKSMFLPSSDLDDGISAEIQTVKKSLQKLLSSYISEGAAAESDVAIRAVSLEAARKNVDAIGVIIDGFGPKVKLVPEDANSRKNYQMFKDALDRNAGLSTRVTDFDKRLTAANINAKTYEEAQKAAVEFAKMYRKEVDFMIEAHDSIIKGQAQLAGALDKASSLALATNWDATEHAIKNAWRKKLGSVACTLGTVKPWFCDEPSAMFRAILD